jgi:hypothetical protein
MGFFDLDRLAEPGVELPAREYQVAEPFPQLDFESLLLLPSPDEVDTVPDSAWDAWVRRLSEFQPGKKRCRDLS